MVRQRTQTRRKQDKTRDNNNKLITVITANNRQ